MLAFLISPSHLLFLRRPFNQRAGIYFMSARSVAGQKVNNDIQSPGEPDSRVYALTVVL